jgi:hypothetical protein
MAVMIGIDPHKRSHTAVALDGTEEVLGQLRVTADRRQLDRLLRFAKPWPERVWAVENANGLGRMLSRQLLAAGRPSWMSPRSCRPGCGHCRAPGTRPTATMHGRPRSPGRTGTGVTPMTGDDPLLVLFDVVLERRWQLVSARQKTLYRIHDQLTCLLPGGAGKHLTADKTAALLRRIRPTDPVGIRCRLIVRELIAELRALDRKIAPVDADIAWMLDEHGHHRDRHRRHRPNGRGDDPGGHRRPDPVPQRRGVRVVRGHRTDRRVVGRHDPSSAEPRRQPAAQTRSSTPRPRPRCGYPDPRGRYDGTLNCPDAASAIGDQVWGRLFGSEE